MGFSGVLELHGFGSERDDLGISLFSDLDTKEEEGIVSELRESIAERDGGRRGKKRRYVIGVAWRESLAGKLRWHCRVDAADSANSNVF